MIKILITAVVCICLVLISNPPVQADNCCRSWNDPNSGGSDCTTGLLNEQYCLAVLGTGWDYVEFNANAYCGTADECVPTSPSPSSFPEGTWRDSIASTLDMSLDIGNDGSVEETIQFDQHMRIRRSSPYTNSLGYRQIDLQIVFWESRGYSVTLGEEIIMTLSDVTQPVSHVVAEQEDSDYPASVTFNAIFDVSVGGTTVLTGIEGSAVGEGHPIIPPVGGMDIFVADGKTFVWDGPIQIGLTGSFCASDDVASASSAFWSSIPTLSQWGLIVMTLVLLTAGTIVLARRRRSATERGA